MHELYSETYKHCQFYSKLHKHWVNCIAKYTIINIAIVTKYNYLNCGYFNVLKFRIKLSMKIPQRRIVL